MCNDHPVLVASVVLLDEQGRLLVGLRARDMRWATPGGKSEKNETLVETAKREMMEKCGVSLLGEPTLLGITNSRNYACAMLLFHDWEGEPNVAEDSHLVWDWVSPKELLRANFAMSDGMYPLLREFLPAYERQISERGDLFPWALSLGLFVAWLVEVLSNSI